MILDRKAQDEWQLADQWAGSLGCVEWASSSDDRTGLIVYVAQRCAGRVTHRFQSLSTSLGFHDDEWYTLEDASAFFGHEVADIQRLSFDLLWLHKELCHARISRSQA